jgi:hypothetical protein
MGIMLIAGLLDMYKGLSGLGIMPELF